MKLIDLEFTKTPADNDNVCRFLQNWTRNEFKFKKSGKKVFMGDIANQMRKERYTK